MANKEGQVTIRVDRDTRTKLAMLAKDMRRTMSDTVRELIHEAAARRTQVGAQSR